MLIKEPHASCNDCGYILRQFRVRKLDRCPKCRSPKLKRWNVFKANIKKEAVSSNINLWNGIDETYC